jgi:hypothetical protein
MGRREFCQKEGLALSTLGRQLKRRRLGKWEATNANRLVAVELTRRDREGESLGRSALEVVLSNGRKIAVWPDFDSGTLQRVIGALEKV